ncbi:hypothetical protein ABTF02_18610, partial [Acinetobacter baumannii]
YFAVWHPAFQVNSKLSLLSVNFGYVYFPKNRPIRENAKYQILIQYRLARLREEIMAVYRIFGEHLISEGEFAVKGAEVTR